MRGDLARIIENCLAKNSIQRYATVETFMEYLSRGLSGTPVRVSGNPLGYRSGKFVRRNRASVTPAAIGAREPAALHSDGAFSGNPQDREDCGGAVFWKPDQLRSSAVRRMI